MNPTRPMPVAPQFRRPGSDSWYCPARDINILVPVLTRRALQQWVDGNLHKEMAGWLSPDCIDDDVGKMAEALASFFSEETVIGSDSVMDAFHKSGMDDVPARLRMVMLSMITEELLGAFWWGIRDSVKAEAEKIEEYDSEELARRGGELATYMRMSPFKRMLYRKWCAFKVALRSRLYGDS